MFPFCPLIPFHPQTCGFNNYKFAIRPNHYLQRSSKFYTNPLLTAFDLQCFWPSSILPTSLSSLRTWYNTTYADRFFSPTPPAWYVSVTPIPLLQFLELTYHLPLTLWAIPALLRNDARIPLALLVFGLEVSLSTAVCMAEMLSWEELTTAQRGVGGLGGRYGGYLAVGVFMMLDCYARLDSWIAGEKGLVPVVKKDE
jgi:hypothetical protein